MTVNDSVNVAFANLKANKVRSVLSMLGIVIGTAAVIVVVSIVNGTRRATLDAMMSDYTDLLNLRPAYSEASGRFGVITIDDVERLKRLSNVRTALPEISARKNVRGSIGKSPAVLKGIDEEYTSLYKYELVSGQFLSIDDITERRRVCLITEKLAKKIYGLDFPIDQRMRVEETSLEIAGVVREPEQMSRLGKEGDVLVPISALLRMVKDAQIYSVEIRTEKGKVDRVKKELEDLIALNPKQAGLLEIDDPRVYLKEMEKWAGQWMMQMTLIAGVSLLVGGIGLMNVMLTTVAERTHEIGLRKALGANSKAIMNQFLVEAACLSGVGGLSGVTLGVFISYTLNIVSKGKIFIAIWPVSLVTSFVFSLVLGVVFGLFPASKAAHLSPVEALRYE
jgi:putative ABC transport system permease protein